MILIAHLSDPHFGTEQPLVAAALQRLLADHAPDGLVLSGDITQRARRGQFDAARAFVASLNVPRPLVIPGNHDIPLVNVFARVFAPHAGFARAFGPDLEPIVTLPGVVMIGVNTTRRFRHVDGEVSAAQIARVARELRRASDEQLRLVVVHQPVAVSRDEDRKNLLRGHAAAIAAWSEAGADLILGGHIHLPYVRNLQMANPDLPRRLWAVQAGTSLSHRVRDGIPNSVNLIRWVAPVCAIERWDFDADAGEFVSVAHDELVVDRG